MIDEVPVEAMGDRPFIPLGERTRRDQLLSFLDNEIQISTSKMDTITAGTVLHSYQEGWHDALLAVKERICH